MDIFNLTTKNREKMLSLPFEKRLEITNDIIKKVLEKSKYPIIQFSGGIDSCIMAYLINKIDKNIPCLFNDWGLFLPNQLEFCKKFFKKYDFKYYISNSGYDYKSYCKKYGFPIFKGLPRKIDKKELKKYNIATNCRMLREKCWSNYLKDKKCDYYFVGILASESPQRKNIFKKYGFFTYDKKCKGYRVKPISLLTKEEVFKYCKEKNILYPKDFYKDTYNGKTFHYNHCDLGCFMCGRGFNKFGYGRIGRNMRFFRDKMLSLLNMGMRESLYKLIIDYPVETQYISKFLNEYDKEKDYNVAFDIDGVLTPYLTRSKPYRHQTKQEKMLYEKIKRFHFKNAKMLIYPFEKKFYVISSRRERYRKLTEGWLEKNNIKYRKLVLMEGSLTFNNIINYKEKMLKEYKIKTYYEDDEKIVRYLRKRLPKVNIVHIYRRKGSKLTEKDDSFLSVRQGLMKFF